MTKPLLLSLLLLSLPSTLLLKAKAPVLDGAFVIGGKKASHSYDGKSALYLKGTLPLDYVRKSYLKFDISSLKSSAPKVVTLKLPLFEKPKTSMTLNVFYLKQGSDDWTGNTLNWQNAPGNNDTATGADASLTVPVGSIQVSAGAGEIRFSSAELAKAIRADDNHQATLILAVEGSSMFAVRPPSWGNPPSLSAGGTVNVNGLSNTASQSAPSRPQRKVAHQDRGYSPSGAYYESILRELPAASQPRSMIASSLEQSMQSFTLMATPGQTLVPIEGMPFNQAWRLVTPERLKAVYESGIQHKWMDVPLQAGDVIYLTWMARSLGSIVESGDSTCQLVFKGGPVALRSDFVANSNWQRYHRKMVVPKYADRFEINFWTGYQKQSMEVGGIALFVLKQGTELASLPEEKLNLDYEGRASDAAWRAVAQQNIQKHRKAPVAIQVVDGNGNSVGGAKISIEQIEHAYDFGVTVRVPLFHQQDKAHRYREHVLKKFRDELGVNMLVPENALKPRIFREMDPAFTRDMTFQFLKWAKAEGFEVHGHTLNWGHRRLNNEELDYLKDGNKRALQHSIVRYVRDTVAKTKPYVKSFDVLNEHFKYQKTTALLGLEGVAEWFRSANKEAPDLSLIWNEHLLLARGAGAESCQQQTYENIRKLQELGAPIHGIGFQSHMGMSATPVSHMLKTLDRFHQMGLEIRISELDITVPDPNNPDIRSYQLDMMRDTMTVAFSHPGTTSITWWAPVYGNSYDNTSNLINLEGELTPLGKLWRKLVRESWWTQENTESDDSGKAKLQAFHGRHKIIVEHQGRRVEREVTIDANGKQVKVDLGKQKLYVRNS